MVMDQETAALNKDKSVPSDENDREKDYGGRIMRDEEKQLRFKEYLRHKSGDDGQLWGRLPHSQALRQQEMFKNQK